MGATVLAYFSRPWSCGYALSQFTPEDPVPYARFDYHGMGVVSAWLAALIFAAPVLWHRSRFWTERPSSVCLAGPAKGSESDEALFLAGRLQPRQPHRAA